METLRERYEQEKEVMREKHEEENKKRAGGDLAEIQKKKRARTQSSLIPECPAFCYEELRPPLQILICGTGHLICSVCRPKVPGNICIQRCGSTYTGRATAMEQVVRNILGIV